jgi:hypothetical protein
MSDCLLGDRVEDAKAVVFNVNKWAGPLQLGGHLGGLQGHHMVYGLERYVAGPVCVDEPSGPPGRCDGSLGQLVLVVVVWFDDMVPQCHGGHQWAGLFGLKQQWWGVPGVR